jgi:hypothetical protein
MRLVLFCALAACVSGAPMIYARQYYANASVQVAGTNGTYLQDNNLPHFSVREISVPRPSPGSVYPHISDCTEGEDCDWTNINECTIGDWSGYGTCSRDCGTGRKFRTREILETGPNAAACPPLTDWASCNPEHCRKFYFTAVLNSC